MKRKNVRVLFNALTTISRQHSIWEKYAQNLKFQVYYNNGGGEIKNKFVSWQLLTKQIHTNTLGYKIKFSLTKV